MFPFYQMKTESIIKRKEKEKFFTRTFLPKLNALYIRVLSFNCLNGSNVNK